MNLEKTIMIIDDIETNIHSLIEILDDSFDILASTDVKEALEIIEEESVDLILLDIMMPILDGFEVCKIVKANPQTENIPVIFITSSSDEETISNAYELGASNFIKKPFKSEEILTKVKKELS